MKIWPLALVFNSAENYARNDVPFLDIRSVSAETHSVQFCKVRIAEDRSFAPAHQFQPITRAARHLRQSSSDNLASAPRPRHSLRQTKKAVKYETFFLFLAQCFLIPTHGLVTDGQSCFAEALKAVQPGGGGGKLPSRDLCQSIGELPRIVTLEAGLCRRMTPEAR